jgi:hypothetical protein
MSSVRVSRRLPLLAMGLLGASACASSTSGTGAATPAPAGLVVNRPTPDPRIGLKAGRYDAGEASWNMKLLSTTKSPPRFENSTNSDLAFTGNYAIQGNYNGWQIWDISTPTKPTLVTDYYCPASQSDVSVYGNLLFISGEGLTGRLDCGDQPIRTAVSKDRLRGLRIFDISDIRNPKNVGNVQTCRGSHTHTVLEDPKDRENVYVYISGSAGIRPADELPGCTREGPSSAMFRIEVVKVPLKNPSAAAIVTSPRIFEGLTEAPMHGASPVDRDAFQKAKAAGAFTAMLGSEEVILPTGLVRLQLDSIVKARGGTGTATAADSAAFRAYVPTMLANMMGRPEGPQTGPRPGPNQCHDITVFPAIGMAGGACEGYGLLLDIRDPANPVRVDAVADSNFSYWHSATFNNDGTKVLFSDEWGGGGQPKCRAGDPPQWGANALFAIQNRKMVFKSYYKLSAQQTPFENCVAHNGSLIPIPGRDVMVQAFYQGGLTVFDWTDVSTPVEIAFFDRGPVDGTRMGNAGSWSVYWYNGLIVSSEIGRGLDVLELTPSPMLTQHEIDASKTVKLGHLNAQGQPKYVWPTTFVLAKAYVDQLARSGGLNVGRIAAVREALAAAERAGSQERAARLRTLAGELDRDVGNSRDAAKVRMLSATVRELATRS